MILGSEVNREVSAVRVSPKMGLPVRVIVPDKEALSVKNDVAVLVPDGKWVVVSAKRI